MVALVCTHTRNLVTREFSGRPETLCFCNILLPLNTLHILYMRLLDDCQTEAVAKSVWFKKTWGTMLQTCVVAKCQVYDTPLWPFCMGFFFCSLPILQTLILRIHLRKKIWTVNITHSCYWLDFLSCELTLEPRCSKIIQDTHLRMRITQIICKPFSPRDRLEELRFGPKNSPACPQP